MAERSGERWRIRPARVVDAVAIARIQISSWRATYEGIVPDSYLDSMAQGDFEQRWRSRLSSDALMRHPLTCCFVVERAGGEVVGFALGGAPQPLQNGSLPEGFDSELHAMYLAPGFERQGLGRRLTHAVARHLRQADAHSIIIWALAENPNRGFYETLGGVPTLQQRLVIGGRTLLEVAFAWPDLDTLIVRTTPHD